MKSTVRKYRPVLWACLAAALFGSSVPFSKELLASVPPYMMAAFLYLGAGAGMALAAAARALTGAPRAEARLAKADLPFVLAMVLLDVAAPILLMLGLRHASASNTSLLSNFEIVATSLIALAVFHEAIGWRQWLAIGLITASSLLLSVGDSTAFSFSTGSLFVLLACVCWGLENNCTRGLSLKDPTQIVLIKGLGSGTGSLAVAFAARQALPAPRFAALAMLLGFVSYGLSIYFYVKAQRELGAARTSAFYAVAPFLGALLSILVLGERLTASFAAAALVMAAGVLLCVLEKHSHVHTHGYAVHTHQHSHDDGHHLHIHDGAVPPGPHTHEHVHLPMTHEHEHRPDMHHRHAH